jgi:hypothetical protein
MINNFHLHLLCSISSDGAEACTYRPDNNAILSLQKTEELRFTRLLQLPRFHDLAPWGFCLFGHIKKEHEGKNFRAEDKVISEVRTLFESNHDSNAFRSVWIMDCEIAQMYYKWKRVSLNKYQWTNGLFLFIREITDIAMIFEWLCPRSDYFWSMPANSFCRLWKGRLSSISWMLLRFYFTLKINKSRWKPIQANNVGIPYEAYTCASWAIVDTNTRYFWCRAFP